MQPGPVANSVYVGGAFSNVNGKKSKSLALLSLSTGKAVAGFVPPAMNGSIYTMRTSAGRLFIGGSFTTISGVTHDGLATLSMTTGALDPYVNVQLTGHHNSSPAGRVRTVRSAPGPWTSVRTARGRSCSATSRTPTGSCTTRSSCSTSTPAPGSSTRTGTPRNSRPLASPTCSTPTSRTSTSPRTVRTSRSAATGGKGMNTDGTNGLCDSASRWTTSDTGTNVKPVWVDYTGTDTLWSIAVTGTAIYVGGHERWVNNFKGPNTAGEGAVPRPGIAALDPVNGMPFSWNPGRNPRGRRRLRAAGHVARPLRRQRHRLHRQPSLPAPEDRVLPTVRGRGRCRRWPPIRCRASCTRPARRTRARSMR